MTIYEYLLQFSSQIRRLVREILTFEKLQPRVLWKHILDRLHPFVVPNHKFRYTFSGTVLSIYMEIQRGQKFLSFCTQIVSIYMQIQRGHKFLNFCIQIVSVYMEIQRGHKFLKFCVQIVSIFPNFWHRLRFSNILYQTCINFLSFWQRCQTTSNLGINFNILYSSIWRSLRFQIFVSKLYQFHSLTQTFVSNLVRFSKITFFSCHVLKTLNENLVQSIFIRFS